MPAGKVLLNKGYILLHFDGPSNLFLTAGISQKDGSNEESILENELAIRFQSLFLLDDRFLFPFGINVPGCEKADSCHLQDIRRQGPRVGAFLAYHIGSGDPPLLH